MIGLLFGTFQVVGASCAAGLYSEDGGATCLACPAGSKCPLNSVAPAACTAGYYSTAGSSVCSQCPAGYSCSSASATPTRCAGTAYSALGETTCTSIPSGHVSADGASVTNCADVPGTYVDTAAPGQCTPCPPGYQCSSATSKAACAAGTYSLGLATSCTPCTPGAECRSTKLGPTLCPEGTFSEGSAAVACTICPAGRYCAGAGRSSAPACDAGKYSFAGAASCSDCPAGFACPGGVAPATPCAPGTYSVLGAGSCTACAAGSVCSSTTAVPTVPPSSGYYTDGSDFFAAKCPAGSSCPTVSAAVACPSGAWSAEGAESCTAAGSGKVATTSAAAPITCPDGYQVSGSTCAICPFGVTCAQSSMLAGGTPTSCPADKLCLAGSASSSTACPDYMDCSTEAMALKRCDEGQYLKSSGGTPTCAACPAGYYCSGSTTTAVGAGYYSPAGDSSRHICPPGHACADGASAQRLALGHDSEQGATTSTECPSGWACPDPAAPHRRIDCGALPGYYGDEAGLAACKLCPGGSQCPIGAATATACAAGYYSFGGAAACKACPAGSACANDPTTGDLRITACTLGTYSAGGQAACQACPAGHSCSLTAATACPVGMYAEEGSGFCWHPPRGIASVTTSGAQTPCASGTFKLDSESSCTACPAGHRCPAADKAPEKCPPGTSQSATGQTSCVDCSSGSYALFGQTQCRTCPAGHACASTERLPIKCSMGTYATAGSTSCSLCTAGYLCQGGSTTATPEHSLCPAGHYCSQTSTSVSVLPCAAGKYNPNRGQSAASACLNCPLGSYCPLGTAVPLTCTSGAACPVLTTSNFEHPCPAGKFLNKRGAESTSECVACPEYYYCPAMTTYPVKCMPGHYCPAESTDTQAEANLCPAGTYGGLDSLKEPGECQPCPAGHYCPEGAVFPTQCAPGRYSATTSAKTAEACLACPEQTVCPFYGQRHSNTGIYCGHGSVCPSGTRWQHEASCAAGSYSDSHTITLTSQCVTCPAKYACPQRTGLSVGTLGTNALTNPKVACAAGHYCPAGTASAKQYPCPAGKYSPETDNEAESQCITCPPGQYCLGGKAAPDGPCSKGHYCPTASSTATSTACPSGTYQPVTGGRARGDCLICPLGQYCTGATTTPTDCAAGKFGRLPGLQAAASSSAETGCESCLAGWQCPSARTIDPTPCGAGFYSAAGATTCTACPRDHYCDSETTSETQATSQKCDNGYLCDRTGIAEKPYHVHASYSCPAGKYCADSDKNDCPAGTWQPLIGAGASTQCLVVPAGYYASTAGASSYLANVCATGFYCPQSSTSATSTPCPAGTWRALTRGAAEADCGICPAGSFCPANTRVPFDCPLGYYCVQKTEIPEPCPLGTFGASVGLRRLSECTDCWGGRYCSQAGLKEPDGRCDAGYYCTSRATNAAPTDGTTGNVCPTGGYCPKGTKDPSSCPFGTYNPGTGKVSSDDCIPCPGGQYCSGSNSPEPTGDCHAGYYCPGGSHSPTQEAARPGYFTASKAFQETPCPMGTYSPVTAQPNNCLTCAAGRYCPDTQLTVQVNCSAGYYCPQGSSSQIACPIGKYNDHANGEQLSDCHDCTPGYYCNVKGLSMPTLRCSAGSYCIKGATQKSYSSTATETQGSYGRCPFDHFCPEGTGLPQHCGNGRYSNGATGLAAESECLSCPAGKYCQAISQMNTALPSGDCEEGYYCEAGSSTGTPYNKHCVAGQYCPTGSSAPTACGAGTYQPSIKQAKCIPCPAGYYCESGATTTTACPAGHYCPENTKSSTEYPCPIGTYSDKTLRTEPKDCLACPPGSYCAAAGLTAVSGDCTAGYYCTIASPSATPNPPTTTPDGYQTTYALAGTTFAEYGGQCAVGFYCPPATPIQVPCPPGYVCSETGMTEAHIKQQGDTYKCPGGKYCARQTSSASAAPSCEAGYYCPLGSSAMTPCPAGTTRSGAGGNNVNDCTPCPQGQYCSSPGQAAPTGICAEGYICREPTGAVGAIVATPPEGLCALGFKCEAGGSAQIPCNGATEYQDEQGQGSCKTCPAGYYCTDTNIWNCRPIDGTTSFYCPSNTRDRVYCKAGKYNIVDMSQTEDDCLPCPPGSYCSASSATVTPAQKWTTCPAGSFCPGGTSSPIACLVGFYCPAGSNIPVPCDPGSVCSATGLSVPDGVCEAGYFCTHEDVALTELQGADLVGILVTCASSSNVEPPTTCQRGASSTAPPAGACTAGHYCPAGSHSPTACPIGTFSPDTTQKTADTCKNCKAGSFCPHRGMTSEDNNCKIGFYCPSGSAGDSEFPCPAGSSCVAASAAPSLCVAGTYQPNEQQGICENCPAGRYCEGTGLTSATVCPEGYYCPAGATSGTANPCPAGKESNLEGLSAASECQLCTHGKYCANPATKTFTSVCAAGYECYADPASTTKQTTATPETGKCKAGTYCDAGTIKPSQCPPGSYGDSTSTAIQDSVTQCKACIEGHYCPKFGLDNSATGLLQIPECGAGYICQSGAKHPADLGTNTTIRLCPAGSYCLAKTQKAVPCPAGSYQPQDGQGSCLPCPPGFECLTEGLTAPNTCSKGYYCPASTLSVSADGLLVTYDAAGLLAGATTRKACPAGTYGPSTYRVSVSECADCPSGQYCSGPTEGDIGRSTPDGPCTAGSLCNGNAIKATYSQGTQGDYYKQVAEGSSATCYGLVRYGQESSNTWSSPLKVKGPYECSNSYFGGDPVPGYAKECQCSESTNGPCPTGHYCPQGTAYPVPCAPGTYQPATGSTSCLGCPEGHYCPRSGINVALSADTTESIVNKDAAPHCDDGFYCKQSANNSRPTDGVTGRLCATAHYCQKGMENECPAGTYAPRTGQAECDKCPLGYACAAGVSAPTPCGNGKYCPVGSGTGEPCPAGTYTPSGIYGLETADQCTPCPPGRYCSGGGTTFSGLCDAGYFCISNATTKTNTTWTLPEDEIPAANIGNGGIIACPAGFYCESGTTLPTACEDGLYSLAGSQRESDCTPCDAGSYCQNGTRRELPCPAGHYCLAQSLEPTPCRKATYGPKEGASTEGGCYACPAGSLCDEAGISDLGNYRCPPGHYCLRGALEPQTCPRGTFRARHGGKSRADCAECLSGYHCPQYGTVTPLLCQVGTYCSGGDVTPVTCPAGTYCPAGSATARQCPGGYFCEGASERFTKCVNGTYCEPGSPRPTPCPGGRFGSGDTNNRDLERGCLTCGRGSYSTDQTNLFEWQLCWDCPAGYVCLGATSSATPTDAARDKGFMCPKGHHCPPKSYKPLQCPAGTYSKRLGAGRSAEDPPDCLPCWIGGYNDLPAQEGCTKCGPSATTYQGGATTCTCKGAFRRFIKSTGSCLCESGYRPKNNGGPEADSASDCELIVKAACAAGQAVDMLGGCLSADDVEEKCNSQCNGSGTLVEGTGLCQCSVVEDVDTVCDANCRATEIKPTLGADGQLTLTDPVTGKVARFDPTTIEGFGGSAKCSGEGECKLTSLGKASDGSFTADYATNPLLLAKEGSHNMASKADRSSTRLRALKAGRLLQASGDTPAIRNPVLCMNAGSVVVFDIVSSELRYPVYVKDSILNTNQDFDRAPFDELASQVNAGVPLKMWAHEFTEEGIYVFSDSIDKDKLTVISVKGAGGECADPDSPIQSLTEASLSAVGIEAQPKSVQPKWRFIISTLVVLVTLPFIVIGAFVYLHNRNAAQMKQASGMGDALNIYQDKVKAQEARDRERESCFACLCGRKKTAEEDENAFKKDAGPKYNDLNRLLEDFRSEYLKLRDQLEEDPHYNPDRLRDDGEMSRDPREDLIDERIRAFKELKDFVKDNQDCLRDYLGIEDEEAAAEAKKVQEEQGPDQEPQASRERHEAQKLIGNADKRDEEQEANLEDIALAKQQAVFEAQQESSDQIRQAARDKFKKKLGDGRLSEEDSRALLGEVEGKLENIDALMRGEEQEQNKMLNDALERRRKRRAGVKDKLEQLADKKEQQEKKYGRKLVALREQEVREREKVESELAREREQEVADMMLRTEEDKERRENRLQRELKELKKKDGAKAELEFGDKLAAYKDQVAGLEHQMNADRDKQREALEERLRKRREARLKNTEDQIKEDEAALMGEMQSKSRKAAEDLGAARDLVAPIYDQDQRMQKVEEALNDKAPAVASISTSTDPMDLEASLAAIGEDPEVAALQQDVNDEKNHQDAMVQSIQNQLQQEDQRTESQAKKLQEQKAELKRRIDAAEDEGEKRRLLAQLGQVDKAWKDHLAKENEEQARKLKEALEARARARKKKNQKLQDKRDEKLVEAQGQAIDGMVNTDPEVAEEGGRKLVQEVMKEFGQGDAIQATEDHLDKAQQEELADLLNKAFNERSKGLKKALLELLAKKEGDYDLVKEEFEPQYDLLRKKKASKHMPVDEYKSRLDKLTEEESERKMDIEIEYNDREQKLQDELEGERLKQEAALKDALKERQQRERKAALDELKQYHQDDPFFERYLDEQASALDRELRSFKKQVEKDKAAKIAAIEDARDARLQEIKDKERKMLNWEDQVKAEEEKSAAAFAKQKEAIMARKQQEQESELQRGLTKDEAARVMQRHKEDLARLEDALAAEQRRQAEALRDRIARRNKDSASQRIQRQIKMAVVQKRRAQQKETVGNLLSADDDQLVQSKEALSKCLSKASHMRRVTYKGSFSKAPAKPRKMVELELALLKKFDGKEPIAELMEQLRLDGVDTGSMQQLDGTAIHSEASDGTIALTEESFIGQQNITYKALLDHVERIERGYQELAHPEAAALRSSDPPTLANKSNPHSNNNASRSSLNSKASGSKFSKQ